MARSVTSQYISSYEGWNQDVAQYQDSNDAAAGVLERWSCCWHKNGAVAVSRHAVTKQLLMI